MAEQSDGVIIVDTKIDLEGFKAGSDKMKKAVSSMNTAFKNLGPIFSKALSGNAGGISSFDAKATVLKSTISEIESQMKSLGSAKVPTEAYQWLTAEINKANAELTKLYERQSKMEATGVQKNSRAWQSLQYDIDLAKRKIADYKAEQSSMRANGTAFQSGVNTAEYSKLSSALAGVKARLAEMVAQVEKAAASTGKLATVGKTVKNIFGKIGNTGKKAFSGIANVIKKAASKMKLFNKHTNHASFSMNSFSGRMKMMLMMIKQMIVMRAFMGVLTAIGDGFKNLAQYSDKTNSELSDLKSSLTQLKNGLASAFAPILTVVTPSLVQFIDLLSRATSYIGQLFAALTGATTYVRAKKVQEDFAASLKDTADAADKAKNSLSSFDDLNVVTSNKDTNTGEVSPEDMFEEVPIESKITDFISRLKAVFAKGDYDSVGAVIGKGINRAFQKLKDFISWDSAGGVITSFVGAVAEGFNSLIHTVDWKLIGDSFAQGFNTAINTLFFVLTNFDWPGLSAGFAQSLNGFVSGIDWSGLGTTLSTGLIGAIAALRSTITTFDWAHLGQGIADSINNIDWVGILSNLAGTISDILKGALDFLIGLAETLDWNKLGSDLWNGLLSVITNIDWLGIISKAFQLLGNALAGSVSLIVGIAKLFWKFLRSAFESTKNYFGKYIEEAGGNVIQGLLSGIWNGVKNMGTWIKTHIFEPFISGFKKVFGIHSPSTVMAENGSFLIEGLLNGIKKSWSGITGFLGKASTWGKDLCQNMAEGISKSKNKVESAVKGVAEKIKSFLGFSEPEDGPLSRFHTYMPDMLDLMAKGIRDNEGAAISAVSDLAGAISNEIQNGERCFTIDTQTAATSEIGGFLMTFADRVTGSFANLISRLQTIANGVTFAMPAMAGGTVIPYHMVCVDADKLYSADNRNSDILEELQALKDKLDDVVEAIENKETGITDAEIYSSVKKSVRTEEKSTGRSPF